MSTKTILRRAALAATALAAIAPASAWASGYYLAEQSAKGTGRADSGEVADTGTDSLWWNPSAIAGTEGFSSDINASLILPRAKITDTGTAIAGAYYKGAVGGDSVVSNPIRNGVVPAGAIAYGINDKVAVGLAVSAPYNFTTQYPSTAWTRYSAERTSLRTIDIQPTLAFQPIKGLRIGVGWNIEHVSATFGNAMPNVSPLLGDGSETLQGKGWDLGVSAGAQWQAGPLTLGASYKSAIKHKLDGSITLSGLQTPLSGLNGSYGASANFTTPWMAIFGARLAVAPQVTLDVQATRTGWSKFNAINLTSAVSSGAIPEGYHDTWTYAGGADFALSPKTTLRAGVARDLSPVPNASRDARVPDSNRWVFALGGSHAVTSHLTLDAGAQYITLDSAAINRDTGFYLGSPLQTVVATSGEMSGAHVVILSLGGRMSF